MRILLLTNYFPPEIGSASHLFYDLAREFVRCGEEVYVITGFPKYHVERQSLSVDYRHKMFMSEEMDGIRVLRIRTPNLPRRILSLRGINQFMDAFAYLIRGLTVGYDFMLVYSPPLPLGLTALVLKLLRGGKVIFNVQDLFPKEAIDMGFMTNKLIIRFFYELENFIYKHSDLITVHSEGNKRYIESRGVEPGRVYVVPSWVNTEELSPGSKSNEFSLKYGLDDKFVVSFAGILGYLQDFDVILRSAKNLADYSSIRFIIVGDGVAKDYIANTVKKERLENVDLLPMQSRARYPLVLHSSDVCLVTLTKQLRTPVVPSKLLSIMACAKPIVATMPLNGDAPRIIHESRAGFCYDAGDSDGMTEGILYFYHNRDKIEEFGMNGRKYVLENYSVGICCHRYRELFQSLKT